MDDIDAETIVNSNILPFYYTPWSQSGSENSIVMSSNSSHLQRQEDSEGDSDEESLEYYFNFGELTKKRVRVTILDSTQKKISRWESPFKKMKVDLKKSWRASGRNSEDMKTVYVDCNSSFLPEADVKEQELDSIGTGFGETGYKVHSLIPSLFILSPLKLIPRFLFFLVLVSFRPYLSFGAILTI